MEVKQTLSFLTTKTSNILSSGGGQGNECCHEEHEPGENQWSHGPVRERVRGPGRTDERDGGRHESDHGHQHPPGQRGGADETGGR